MLKDRSDIDLTPTQANNGEHERQQFETNMLIAEIFEYLIPVLGIAGSGFRSLEEGTKVSWRRPEARRACRRRTSPPSKKQTPLSGTRRRLGLFGAPVQGHKAYPGAREKL